MELCAPCSKSGIMKDDSKIANNLRVLISVASQLPSQAEREALLDRIIQNALKGTASEDLVQLSTLIADQKAANALQIAANSTDRPVADIDNPASSLPLQALDDLEQSSIKRSRGRPRLKPKPKYDPKYGVLNLLDALAITHPIQRKRLEKLAIAARAHSAGGRGIPQTETPDTFRFLRRGGPAPKPILYLIDGETISVRPPIISKGSGGEANAIWVEYEKLLTGIEDITDDPAAAIRREYAIRSSQALKKLGIHWVEGVPTTMAAMAVPTINAETARNILRAVPCEFVQNIEFIDFAPASWLTPKARWTDTFIRFVRSAFLGRIAQFGRRERIALARMLLESLGRIERKMFEIAFKN